MMNWVEVVVEEGLVNSNKVEEGLVNSNKVEAVVNLESQENKNIINYFICYIFICKQPNQ